MNYCYRVGCLAVVCVVSLFDRHRLLARADNRHLLSVEQPSLNRSIASSKSIVTYAPSAEDFPNPERGFHDVIDLMSGNDFRSVSRSGFTLARTMIRLDEYRNRPLPPAFLAKMERQFQLARQAGIKLVVRFSYNFPTTDREIANAPDASLDRTLSHIQQLKPILAAN
jgi:hypothetical protein